jgi:hypothetical protein
MKRKIRAGSKRTLEKTGWGNLSLYRTKKKKRRRRKRRRRRSESAARWRMGGDS